MDKKLLGKEPYTTLSKTIESEIPTIKGSRFFVMAAPIESDGDASAFLQTVKLRYPDARYWCWAYQLREQNRTRFSDDGEPNGSAGKPILAPIIGRELVNVMIVVIRYFGGVKLGVGGLVRAYSQAANDVLSVAEEQGRILRIVPKVTLNLQYGYDDTGQIAALLSAQSLAEKDIEYTDVITSQLLIEPSDVNDIIQQLTDYTSGRIRIKKVEDSVAD